MHTARIFFSGAAPTGLYTLSLHDALPILAVRDRLTLRFQLPSPSSGERPWARSTATVPFHRDTKEDRKSTRLNSSHVENSYAVFCLKNKITARSADSTTTSPLRKCR